MRNKRIIAAILCGVALLFGCGKAEAGSGDAVSKEGKADVQEENQDDIQEISPSDDDSAGADSGMGKSNTEAAASAGEGVVVIEAGPEKKFYEDGNLVYTLHDFRLYDSPEEASIDKDELMTIDAEYYMDRSKFLTLQVDINNIDFAGDEKDGEGEMNISMFTISPNEPDESLQWAGSYPVYLSEPGGKEKYYHVWVKPGETKTVTIAFYVPVMDTAELRSSCKISLCGSYEEGYVYDIPEVR